MLVGEILFELDSRYETIKKELNGISTETLITFSIKQGIHSLNSCLSTNINIPNDSYFDSLHTAIETLLPYSDNTKPMNKNISYDREFYLIELLVTTIMERDTFVDLWKKIRYFEWQVIFSLSGHQVHFKATNKNLEFGKAMSVAKYQNDMMQLSLLRYRDEGFQSIEENFRDSIIAQTPFYYREFKNEPFHSNKNINLCLVIDFWIYVYILANNIRAVVEGDNIDTTNIKERVCFKKNNFIKKASHHLNISFLDCEYIIKLFSSSSIEMDDIWKTPILEMNKEYWVFISPILTGQFQRVINGIATKYIKNSTVAKGVAFEKSVANELKDDINRNLILKNGFCEVLKINYKIEINDRSQEIDVILRIGETYLLIETKSANYKTSQVGYNRVMKKLRESNIAEKKHFFIKNYKKFKKYYDPKANFKLNEDKIISCYITSTPHGVGTFINDTPVLDLSTVGRYFSRGSIEFQKVDNSFKEARFYHTFSEAEDYLDEYLNSPPQFIKYTNGFKCETRKLGKICNRVIFTDYPYIDISEESLEKSSIKVLEKINSRLDR